MIGNWSLGDYFKEEQLNWIYEFFVEKIGLDINRIYATVFEGDKYAPKDNTSIKILQSIFKKYGIEGKEGERIFTYGKDDNWWQRGNAPGELGGPDSEIFYYLGEGTGLGQNPAENQDEFLEIGNSVFMQYKMTQDGGWEELSQKNVDFGGGLERIALVAQGKRDIYETDNFHPIINEIEKLTGKYYLENKEITKTMRILADHMRASTMLAMDGVLPSNKDQGYILRRLIRRMSKHARVFNINEAISPKLVNTTIRILSWLYPELEKKKDAITNIIGDEEKKFHDILKKMEPKVQKIIKKTSTNEKDLALAAFNLFQSSGYPLEIFIEDLAQNNLSINVERINNEYERIFGEHKNKSRIGAKKKFKGGLADSNEQTVKYHTATHLIHQALNDVLQTGDIKQEGSNITADRLRFDFYCSKKPSSDDKKQVEEIVNEKIVAKLTVQNVIMDKKEADKLGVKSFFKEKYEDKVKVYFIGNNEKNIQDAYSKELCGGPHVANTAEIGKITIYKLEKIGNNKYRLYAK
jgi:alanyl-tRNA synthetase